MKPQLITVDARGAGQGKTTDTTNGIYSRITKLTLNNDRVFIVNPSKDLQSQYQADLAKRSIAVTVINSGDENNKKPAIREQLDEILPKKPAVISVTDQGFNHNVIDYASKQNYHLIIDECIKPMMHQVIVSKYQPLSTMRWDLAFSVCNEELLPAYCELELTADAKNDRDCQGIDFVNYRIFVLKEEYKIFMETAMKQDAALNYIAVLRPDRLEGWKSIHIAAAAFGYTFTAVWLKLFGLKYTVIKDFEPHRGRSDKKIVIHYSEINITKDQYVKNKKLVKALQDYASSIANNGEYISLYNKGVIKEADDIAIDHIKYGHKIKHNAHGINQFQHINTCLVLSRLKLSDHLRNFIDAVSPGTSGIVTEAYTHYQFIMRSSLRNSSAGDCHIIIPSGISAKHIMEEFFVIDENLDAVSINDLVNSQFIKKEQVVDKVDILAELSKLPKTFIDIPGCNGKYQLHPDLILRKITKKGNTDTDHSKKFANNKLVNYGAKGTIRIKALIKLTFGIGD